jgi:PEGA domain
MMERDFGILAAVFILVLVMAVPVSAANSMGVDAGNSQTATVGTAVATSPSVKVVNGSIPVSGVEITFATTDGSVTGATQTTGADGIATVGSWVLGTTAGSNTLTATGAGLTGSPVIFSATGTAGPATQITKNGGDSQSATVETAVATPPSVRVMDAHDNPVSGQQVIFSAEPASSTVSGSTQTTGSDGIATVGSWTLGTVAGTNHLTATMGTHSVIFSADATASAAAPTISTITPAVGLNTGTLTGVAIVGTSFSASGVVVNLTRSGEDNITGTCSRNSATSITCSFPLSDKEDGTWNVVVVNDDGKSVTKSNGFTVYSEAGSDVTITSISPAAAMAGDDIDFTITGKDFVTAMTYEVYLYNSDYENITAEDIEVKSATSIKGTFDLDNDAEVDTYQLCIINGFGSIECKKNAFKITTNEVGSIEISSSPTGATIYIDDVANGTTPRTIDDIIVGSYKITLKKAGYQDWAKMVKVEEDETTEVDGTLYAAATTTATPARTTTQATPRPTTAPTPVRTTAEKTVKIPTTLADTPSPTEESPADPAIIIGAVCLAFIALRKH